MSPGPVHTAPLPETLPDVWPVEKTEAFETYSNGLRIDNLFVVANRPRAYAAIPRAETIHIPSELRSDPAGIVFHTTESHMVPFAPERNGALKAAGLGLLDYVRRHRSYHFVVDRFGRVHRVVQEADAANHAGWSVWADEKWIYLNLNDSFLAVAFEAKNASHREAPLVNSAQIHAGRVLTEMLRARYRIPSGNCVTHAQVSVNPRNSRIGYHTDWATHFPFGELGLTDNYRRPLPSLYLFGFDSDPALEDPHASGLWQGLLVAEQRIRQEASARGMPVSRYRAILRQRYREIITALERTGAWKERYP